MRPAVRWGLRGTAGGAVALRVLREGSPWGALRAAPTCAFTVGGSSSAQGRPLAALRADSTCTCTDDCTYTPGGGSGGGGDGAVACAYGWHQRLYPRLTTKAIWALRKLLGRPWCHLISACSEEGLDTTSWPFVSCFTCRRRGRAAVAFQVALAVMGTDPPKPAGPLVRAAAPIAAGAMHAAHAVPAGASHRAALPVVHGMHATPADCKGDGRKRAAQAGRRVSQLVFIRALQVLGHWPLQFYTGATQSHVHACAHTCVPACVHTCVGSWARL